MRTLQDIKTQFEDMQNMPLFEIPIKGEEYELIYITIEANTLHGRGEHTTAKVAIDTTFSLDEHLTELYEKHYNQLFDLNLIEL